METFETSSHCRQLFYTQSLKVLQKWAHDPIQRQAYLHQSFEVRPETPDILAAVPFSMLCTNEMMGAMRALGVLHLWEHAMCPVLEGWGPRFPSPLLLEHG